MNCDDGKRHAIWRKDVVDCCAPSKVECLDFPYVSMLTSMLDPKVWKGIAFPELHTAAGQLMAELAKKGFLPEAR